MRSSAAVAGLFFGATLAVFGAMVSCGSRTGLLVEPPFEAAADTAPDADAALDVVHRDRMIEEDVTTEDALPLLDVQRKDVILPNDCPDAALTLVYVVSQQNNLMSFYPPTAEFKTIGTLACPAPPPSAPFSMAVDRRGTAFLVFSSFTGGGNPMGPGAGDLYRVSTATAACIGTAFVPDQQGFLTFGMGYVANPSDGGETLFVADDNDAGRLGAIDTRSMQLQVVGPFTPPTVVVSAELTGTGDGRLFAFYSVDALRTMSAISEIDPKTAQVIATSPLSTVGQGDGWAFAFWGGDFYTFTSATGSGFTTVNRFRPSDNSVTQVAQTDPGVTIVGAGVSTCAPQ